MKDFLVSLRTQAWRTAGARFNAARRLKRRELFSTVSLAMFSAISIALAFVQRLYSAQAGSPLDNYLTALSVCLGVFLLAISLMEWGAGNGAKANALHQSAEDINAFQTKVSQWLAQLESGATFGWSDVDGLRGEYEVIKERCSCNHEPLDDELFRATHRLAKEFEGNDGKPRIGYWAGKWVAIRWHASSIWYFAIFWIVIAAVIGFAFRLPQ